MIGIWDKKTGMLGATGRDQVTSIVVLYGPRTTALVACDDGVYEFTCGTGNKWFASKEKIQIKAESKIFSPANMRAAQEDEGYNSLLKYWMDERYTLRYSGGLVRLFNPCRRPSLLSWLGTIQLPLLEILQVS